MKSARLVAALPIALLVGCAAPGPITGVSVRDANFDVVKVLSPAELAEFTRLWENKQEVQASLNNVGGQHFKVDIDRQQKSGGRWLYQTTGYAQYLDPLAQPVYKLQEPEAFNRLIGATK
jgi:hypothetical protein